MPDLPDGYYYISRDEKYTFTQTVNQAQTVKTKHGDLPVVAPGYVHAYSQIATQRKELLWELLLDVMEEQYEDGENPNNEKAGAPADRERAAYSKGLRAALAVLGYGSVTDGTLQMIASQANIRYDNSAEE